MPPLYKQKSRNKAQATQCKYCGSHNTQRVHRTFFEKLVCSFTSGKYAYQKFFCKACKSVTLKSISAAEKGECALPNESQAVG